MTYSDTLDWMFAQLPMYQQKGASAYHGKLDHIRKFAFQLGNPEKKFKSIHVAGTNGKGSSSHMLASVLQEAGYRVGLYTSPHLKDFRERIRIDGQPIGEEHVVEFISSHKRFLEKNKLSFFEMSVGMAFDYFASESVDIAVVEVGLGGRLDSTNIIVPEVSLITNIGMDHTEMLGDTLEKITREKAGIIKPGIPVIISEYQPGVAEVFTEIAQGRNAPLCFAEKMELPSYHTSLLGSYQEKNIKGVLATLQVLKEFDVTHRHIRDGLMNVSENTGLKGRWQLLRKNPDLILDTAHNSEGLAITMGQLKAGHYDNLHLVLGFVKEKDLSLIFPLLPTHAQYYFCQPNIPRGLDVDQLYNRATAYGLKGRAYDSVSEALAAALASAREGDGIYLGGSTFTVAEAL